MTRTVFAARPAVVLSFAATALLMGCEPQPNAEPAPEAMDQQASFITVSGTVTDVMSGRALNSAQVCIHADYESPCAYSETDGSFSLDGVPADAKVALEITRDHFTSLLVPVTTSERDEDWDLALTSALVMSVQARRVGVEMDDEAGILSIRVDHDRRAGEPTFRATSAGPQADAPDVEIAPVDPPGLEIAPADQPRVRRSFRPYDVQDDDAVDTVPTNGFRPGSAVKTPAPGLQGVRIKPILGSDETVAYTNADGFTDKGARRTTADGSALVFDMTPGTRLAAIEAPLGDLSCSSDFGWMHRNSDRIVVFPVEPGFATYVNVDCTRTN